MPDPTGEPGGTVVLGERELAIGFRLIGLPRVVEISPSNAVAEFQKAMAEPHLSLLIASQSIRPLLTDAQRAHSDASLSPLVVFVPTPNGADEVESINELAKRVLGVTLAVTS